ncbi:hypothetical protein FACS189431_1170 [Alphaproteobacteria bacterium]|nr:hypothetical protein FACS189431_1170 [Alphaproteobacteria bacterium]
MNQDYWRRQESGKPLFPDIEWSKPEQKKQRGRLLIVGGSAHGFMAVGNAYAAANAAGAGEVRVALPDVLKKSLPSDIDGVFLPTNPSGGLARDGLDQLLAAAEWSSGIVLVGDSDQNSETAVLLEDLLGWIPDQVQDDNRWITITRDAVDLVRGMGEDLVNRNRTHLVVTFAQVQKLFQSVYYPKVLTFSQQFSTVVEALHKFTITYPTTLTVLHNDQWIVAHNGEVITQTDADMHSLINGSTAARAATYLLWTPNKPLESIVSSWQS